MTLLTTLFSFSGRISRRAYVTIALAGVLIKHVIDVFIAASFHRGWGFLNYLIPVGVPVPLARLAPGDIQFFAIMLAASLPFAWVGLAITAKRFRAIGWPPWSIVLFFVPIANIASFAVAAAWPQRSEAAGYRSPGWLSKVVPSDRLGAAVFAMLLTALFSTMLAGLGTQFLYSYGWGLFAAVPFVQGAIAAYLYSLHGERSLGASVSLALLSVAVTAFALLALALEGGICILMATPIAFGFAAIGAIFGHTVGRRSSRVNMAMLLTCIFLAPVIMGAETTVPRAVPTYVVTTSIEIDAPPDVVWKNVVSFPDLPSPTELPFRAGIAYPMRARIVGHGVGAVRYCEFSTGDFVEPITVWQPERKLAFSVLKSAEPMREWSPYGHIDTPHLHGYMVSRHGEFALTALPGGRTRLTGTTWYQHHLWPATYWAVWSDAIVHDIHLRVLKHIKNLSEGASASS